MLRFRLGAVATMGGMSIAGSVLFVACTGDDPIFAAVADAGEAGTTPLDDAGSDAVARACDPAASFGVPIPVGGLARPDYTEQAAHFSSDERTVVFNDNGIDGGVMIVDGGVSTENFYANIYTVTRATIAEPFPTPHIIYGLTGGRDTATQLQTDPTISSDGQTMYFVQFDEKTSAHSIWTTERTPDGTDYYQPAPAAPANEGDGGQTSPYLLDNGRALYFLSTRNGRNAVYRSSIVNGKLAGAQPVTGIPTNPKDGLGGLAVTPDELTIYWSAVPAGGANLELYVATRSDVDSSFSGTHALKELNTLLSESPSWISPDGCRLYYTSTEFMQVGNGFVYKSDVLVATKPK